MHLLLPGIYLSDLIWGTYTKERQRDKILPGITGLANRKLEIMNGDIMMKLGILVNTKDHGAAIAGIVRSATKKGHEVYLFAMDEGTRILEEQVYVSLVELP